jgi:hypothetical protein
MSAIMRADQLEDYSDWDATLERYPVSKNTIIRAVNAGRFPAPSPINGKVRWLKADLDRHDAYVAEQASRAAFQKTALAS